MLFESDAKQCFSRFSLGYDYESYPGVIHGGIVATVLDEVLSQTVYRSLNNSAFTVGLRVRYGHPMETGVPHVAFGHIVRSNNILIRAVGRIERDSGGLIAAATGSFYPVSESGMNTMRKVSMTRRNQVQLSGNMRSVKVNHGH